MSEQKALFSMAENWKEVSDFKGIEKYPPAQREFARALFYAGFMSCYTMMTDGVASLSEGEAMSKMLALESEISAHIQAVLAGEP